MHMSLTQPLHKGRREKPNEIAVVSGSTRLSFGEFTDRVARLGAALQKLGMGSGDRVGMMSLNSHRFVEYFFGTWWGGGVINPVNIRWNPKEVAYSLDDCDTRILLVDDLFAPMAAELRRLSTSLRTVVYCGDGAVPEGMLGYEALLAEATPIDDAPHDADELAAIMYTGGTTGRPKGVMLSHANMWLGAISVAHYLALDHADRVLGVLPLSFDYGQNQLFSTWAAGACVVPFDYLLPRDVYRAIERERITTLAGVPPLWAQLLDIDPQEIDTSTLKRITNSGGALTRRLINGLRERFPQADIYPMYGLTEAFRSTYLDPALVADHPDSIGRAIPFSEIMIVRPDGAQAAAGEPGELVHAGPLVAQGYWQDPERTAARFRPAPAWSQAGGMAVWSGDSAVADADGLLRFVGRDDEMIKSAGNRISPNEIEEAITAGGETGEAVAIGVPDERQGQAIVVVAKGDGSAEPALRERLRRDLPNFMQPARYIWLAELPRNANGKLDRAGLRGMTS
jgi:acyl-CoA ligase (AMP-forming) (exosortase A-associated)